MAPFSRPGPSPDELAQQKQKGKLVFSQAKEEIAEREKQRKEKEEAAKKARLDAAEKGRLASRQWAEKRKARMAAQKTIETTTAQSL